MAKTRNDKIYEEGEKDGREGNSMSDIANATNPFNTRTDEEQEIYEKGRDEGRTKRDNGTCYLTTACVNTMGLPDNGLELTTLRNFRDRLLQTVKGRNAIREYELIAPEIIQAVEEREGLNAGNVWRSLYSGITTAVNHIGAGRFDEAFQVYSDMTARLKKKYLG